MDWLNRKQNVYGQIEKVEFKKNISTAKENKQNHPTVEIQDVHLLSCERVEIPGNVIFVCLCASNHGARNPPRHSHRARTSPGLSTNSPTPVDASTQL